MNVICKVENASCPRGLNICCGTCDHQVTCGDACGQTIRQEFQTCPDAEVITNELIQFQTAVPDTIKSITNLIQMKRQLDEQEKQLKEQLVKAMEMYGVKSFENDLIKMTYVAPTTRSTIDSARLKKDYPDIVEQYSKISPVSASVRVSLKGGGK